MAVDDPIDYTPDFSFSTLQFENEVVNIIVTSLIAVLILANIGSIISKLVYFTRETSFCYDSWLRAFIFANSDNPVRIVSWIFRSYVYRDKTWKRFPNKRRYDRLLIPMLARIVILLFSIASIAITIPTEKRIKICNWTDYILTFDQSKANFSSPPNTICLDIPLTSKRGSVLATAAYCTCPLGESVERQDSGVAVFRDEKMGQLKTLLFSEGVVAGTASYVEWKRTEGETDRKVRYFRTDLSPTGSDISLETHADIVIKALSSSQNGCTRREPERTSIPNDKFFGYLVPLDCDFNPKTEIDKVNSYLRNALAWVPTEDEPNRLLIEGSISRDGVVTDECPIEVSVPRPILNVAPLFLGLIGSFLLNVIVTIFVSKHGNALDAGFHIIKEALGHDSTSNPLEESTEKEQVEEVQLRKWVCAGGGAYVGFIGRHCDKAVDEFDKNTRVCACVNTVREIRESVDGLAIDEGTASDAFSSYGAFNVQVYADEAPFAPYPNLSRSQRNG